MSSKFMAAMEVISVEAGRVICRCGLGTVIYETPWPPEVGSYVTVTVEQMAEQGETVVS